MALRSSVIKAQLQIADMDRHYYQDHNLTLAQHPSETDQRVMVRLLAFALNAHEDLKFSSNLSDEGESELSIMNLHGDPELWVEFGLPDEKWLRKASQRSKVVKLYAYGGRSLPIWWKQNEKDLKRFENLSILTLSDEAIEALERMYQRSMSLQFSINEGAVLVSDGSHAVEIELEKLK